MSASVATSAASSRCRRTSILSAWMPGTPTAPCASACSGGRRPRPARSRYIENEEVIDMATRTSVPERTPGTEASAQNVQTQTPEVVVRPPVDIYEDADGITLTAD